jgi:predicted dithiol-disulfide oxidoreductase (DUF899 family)
MNNTPQNEIQKLEKEIYDLSLKLAELRKVSTPIEVKNYKFQTLSGEVSLLDLFAGKDQLFAIHNMGQGCRYCTLWADGFNSSLSHLEDRFSVVLMSKDSPELQRKFANSRGWRFRMASHGGGEYIQEQTVQPPQPNMPGIVCYERKGDRIFKKNASVFGPGDQFCSTWHILSLAGVSENEWTPQYNYWQRPAKMDDGGQNVL